VNSSGLRRWARRASTSSGCTSRSYSYPLALVAVHSDAVGVDLEFMHPVDEQFAASICTPRERAELRAGLDPIALWCSKEALAKALGDARRYDPRRLEAPIAWPNGRCGPWRATAIVVPSGYCAWLCWRTTTSSLISPRTVRGAYSA